MHYPIDRIIYNMAFVTPVVDHLARGTPCRIDQILHHFSSSQIFLMV